MGGLGAGVGLVLQELRNNKPTAIQPKMPLPTIFISDRKVQKLHQAAFSSIFASSSKRMSTPRTPMISSCSFLIGAETVIHRAPV